jgi:hypothetical protein
MKNTVEVAVVATIAVRVAEGEFLLPLFHPLPLLFLCLLLLVILGVLLKNLINRLSQH